MPARACDCHVHVFGPFDRFPLWAGRAYTPGAASIEDLISLHFNNGSVNDCAVTRIQAVLVLLHKQAVLDVAVNQAV
jgi:hypothetical protein